MLLAATWAKVTKVKVSAQLPIKSRSITTFHNGISNGAISIRHWHGFITFSTKSG